ncbi:hypothetical protein A5724_07135 [Mycobacterium sp. ACS1612]|uniref:hypothetical protein n=1 Tax=Mycobacterium sp. ACS1612 TaxID=1834117 RepID=UPI0007FD45FC|nr:hypothetical protein [Mycobacterium sp. ACS1612]OBF40820.1 hypothetical protein A5724_07135 [Mycobacterium sp. ACS1612]
MNSSQDTFDRARDAREELGKIRIYKFAGKIYHDYLVGTKIRIKYRTICVIKRFGKENANKTILFYPDKPNYSQVLYKICNTLGCKMTSSLKAQPDLIVAFQDTTRRAHSSVLAEIAANNYVVNEGCDDISKVKVEAVFRQVFGYATFVDPETHVGLCVMKSNDNAMHDGEVVECPTSATRHDVVYQKLINNTAGDDDVLDIRVPVINGELPFVYLKYRRMRYRFSNMNARATMASTDSVFTTDEITKIKQFAKKLGLDFGELDVLRDVDDGTIYIVDVNNTPCGPPNHLGKAESAHAIELLSKAFDTAFLAKTLDLTRKDVR